MAKIDDQIEAAKAAAKQAVEAARKRVKELEARKAKLEARARAAEGKKARALDLRRKLLIGAMVLQQVEAQPEKETSLLQSLDRYLERDADRALFDLPAKAPAAKPGTP